MKITDKLSMTLDNDTATLYRDGKPLNAGAIEHLYKMADSPRKATSTPAKAPARPSASAGEFRQQANARLAELRQHVTGRTNATPARIAPPARRVDEFRDIVDGERSIIVRRTAGKSFTSQVVTPSNAIERRRLLEAARSGAARHVADGVYEIAR